MTEAEPGVSVRAADQTVDQNLLAMLVDAFYADLRQIARRERFRVGAGATLCTTALISEAWLKLQRTQAWENESHFLATAALAMRHVLVDDASARSTAKRNHGQVALSIEADDLEAPDAADAQILEVDQALQRLTQLSPRLAQVVNCRFFAGYSEVETARAMGLTDRAVRREWVKARAWLYDELGEGRWDLAGDEKSVAHGP